MAQQVKNQPAMQGFTSGSERSPGGGNINPFQYFCLKYPMDLAGYNPKGLKEQDTTE